MWCAQSSLRAVHAENDQVRAKSDADLHDLSASSPLDPALRLAPEFRSRGHQGLQPA